MLTNDARRKLMTAGVFALPVGLVWIVGNVLGGPAAVRADGGLKPAGTFVPTTSPIEAEPAPPERAALDRIVRLRSEEFGPTPFFYDPRETIVITDDPEMAPVPDITLQAIMESSTGNRAIIDGRAYKLGDGYGDTEWLVVEINARARSVKLRDPGTNRVHAVSVDR